MPRPSSLPRRREPVRWLRSRTNPEKARRSQRASTADSKRAAQRTQQVRPSGVSEGFSTTSRLLDASRVFVSIAIDTGDSPSNIRTRRPLVPSDGLDARAARDDQCRYECRKQREPRQQSARHLAYQGLTWLMGAISVPFSPARSPELTRGRLQCASEVPSLEPSECLHGSCPVTLAISLMTDAVARLGTGWLLPYKY